jgi:hypothetical protein
MKKERAEIVSTPYNNEQRERECSTVLVLKISKKITFLNCSTKQAYNPPFNFFEILSL